MRRRKVLFRGIYLFALFTIARISFGGPVASGVDEASQRVWEEFRREFPYHIQTLALSERRPDGSRTLIVSEPPPDSSLASIRALDGALTTAGVLLHPVGYDGFTLDVVARIKVDDGELGGLVSRLSRELFHTSYKAHVLRLPAKHTKRTANLDLRVPVTDLDRWIRAAGARFRSIDSGAVVDWRSMRLREVPEVFVSQDPGLVVWWLPAGARLADHLATARQFAIDSDLVVGALIQQEGFAIVGRERLEPLDRLPPLRAETILLLASVETDELAQSYERRFPLAGRYDSQKDWAPIYLSPELRDTEYGSLLNIADQLLKSWSNAGQTTYANFAYPTPPRFPFKKPVLTHLEVDQLTYNWNTSGAGYAVTSDEGETYALNRTGALPVSYLPGGDEQAVASAGDATIVALRGAEDSAYEYFAELSDPNLVRVVQYGALYQNLPSRTAARRGLTEPPGPRRRVAVRHPANHDPRHRADRARRGPGERSGAPDRRGAMRRREGDRRLREAIPSRALDSRGGRERRQRGRAGEPRPFRH